MQSYNKIPGYREGQYIVGYVCSVCGHSQVVYLKTGMVAKNISDKCCDMCENKTLVKK